MVHHFIEILTSSRPVSTVFLLHLQDSSYFLEAPKIYLGYPSVFLYECECFSLPNKTQINTGHVRTYIVLNLVIN